MIEKRENFQNLPLNYAELLIFFLHYTLSPLNINALAESKSSYIFSFYYQNSNMKKADWTPCVQIL